MTRRAFLAASSGAAALAASRRTKIAAIVTAYYRNSHADVFLRNMLRGYYWDGKPHESQLEIAAMYLEQKRANDIGVAEAARYSVPIKATVREAMVPGIQGVALIGEHGDYPLNEKGQKLYPRHRLMKEIVGGYRETGRALPLFVDKHFSTDWSEAKEMFGWSRELGFPLIAGTSLTLTWRRPELELDLGTPVKRAVGYFYGGKGVVRLPCGRGLPGDGGAEEGRRDRRRVRAVSRGRGSVEVERRQSMGAGVAGGVDAS